MRSINQRIIFTVILGLALTYGNVMAAGTSSSSSSRATVSAEFEAGKKAAKSGDYQSAVKYLNKALAQDPNNADTQNLLGYSYRKLGETEKAFKHYEIALKINPKHRGANEYLGELYLETGQLAKAEERLKVLDKSCSWGCEEYDELKEAIEKYKSGKQGAGPY
jgi:Flp pilus assembly protein TadD